MQNNPIDMVVYVATNTINGKKYVGKSISGLAKRVYEHKCESKKQRTGSAFHLAISKYGIEAFVFEELCNCFTPEGLLVTEIECIRSHNTISGEGNSFYGKKHTPETIEIIRNKAIERSRGCADHHSA